MLTSFGRLVCVACLALLVLQAQASVVLVHVPRAGGAYDEVVEALRAELGRFGSVRVDVVDLSGGTQSVDEAVVHVAVGLQAVRHAIQQDTRAPLLSILVPRTSVDSIVAQGRGSRRVASLFLDQPPARQLELARTVLPSGRTVGLVVGPSSARDLDTFKLAATSKSLSLASEFAARESELYASLVRVMDRADVLLAVPDADIVNAQTAQNLLLTSFRSRVPVVAYSAGYVRAGAVAAVFSTPRQVGTEAAGMVRSFLRTGVWPASRYPRLFSVMVNNSVAESYGLRLIDEAALGARLQAAEPQE